MNAKEKQALSSSLIGETFGLLDECLRLDQISKEDHREIIEQLDHVRLTLLVEKASQWRRHCCFFLVRDAAEVERCVNNHPSVKHTKWKINDRIAKAAAALI